MDIFMIDLLNTKIEQSFCLKFCLFYMKKRTFFEKISSFFLCFDGLL